MNKPKPFDKIVLKNNLAVAAIYEPHQFRDSIIQEAIKSSGRSTNQHTGIDNKAFCWVYYDWIGNPIGLSDSKPKGNPVEKFTKENLYGLEDLAKYLNKDY